MLVSKEIIENIYSHANKETLAKAGEFLKQDLVKIVKATYNDEKNFELHAKVKDGRETCDIYAKIQKNELAKVECSCDDYNQSGELCSHMIATVNKFDNSSKYAGIFGSDTLVREDKRFYDRANQYKTFNNYSIL